MVQVVPMDTADTTEVDIRISMEVIEVLIEDTDSKLRCIPKFPLPRWEGSGEGEVPIASSSPPPFLPHQGGEI